MDNSDPGFALRFIRFLLCDASASYTSFLFLDCLSFFSLIMLACIGHAYEPGEAYYVGIWIRNTAIGIDNPFTARDDIDRAHLSLGVASALPSLIIDFYVAIFGSMRLWRGLVEYELWGAVELLQALAANDTKRATSCMRSLGDSSALRVVRALVKIEMVTVNDGYPRLRLKGRKFLKEN